MTPEDFNVIGVGCDVSSELSVQRAFEQVMDTFGRLDSVVASAGKFFRDTYPGTLE
jgi:NAD(P)-dependent dehydrogenase (short-subunit alcohol dehydrogenase family)